MGNTKGIDAVSKITSGSSTSSCIYVLAKDTLWLFDDFVDEVRHPNRDR